LLVEGEKVYKWIEKMLISGFAIDEVGGKVLVMRWRRMFIC
jgi:hypothetical protein